MKEQKKKRERKKEMSYLEDETQVYNKFVSYTLF